MRTLEIHHENLREKKETIPDFIRTKDQVWFKGLGIWGVWFRDLTLENGIEK